MSWEARFVVLYIAGIQIVGIGRFLNHVLLFSLGIINIVVLLCLYTVNALLDKKKKSKEEDVSTKNRQKQDEKDGILISSNEELPPHISSEKNTVFLTSVKNPYGGRIVKNNFRTFFQKYFFAYTFIAWTLGTIPIGILGVEVLPLVTLFFLLHMVSSLICCKDILRGKMYFHKQLLTVKDYFIWLSFAVFGGILFFLAEVPGRGKFSLASFGAFFFLRLGLVPFRTIKRKMFWKFFVPKIYSIIFFITIIGYAVTLYRDANSLLARGIDEKIDFMRQNIQSGFDGVKKRIPTISFFKKDTENEVDKEVQEDTEREELSGHVFSGNLSGSASVVVEHSLSGSVEKTGYTDVYFTGEVQGDQENIAVQENKEMTYRDVFRFFFATGVTLTTKKNSFTYIASSDPDYVYFATAKERGMIGLAVKPDVSVGCQTYIVLKGLRFGRNVGDYDRKNPFPTYWQKAEDVGQLNGCEKGNFVKKGNL